MNDLKRIEILKLLQREWPYWKIHPNPIFKSQSNSKRNVKPKNMKDNDKMMEVMDIINSDNLLREALPTQKMIKRYENIICSMNNMPLSLSTNIGPIGLLDKRIKNKYDKNTKWRTNLNKTSQSLQWNHLQNTLNYNINTVSYDLSDDDHDNNNDNCSVSDIEHHKKTKNKSIENNASPKNKKENKQKEKKQKERNKYLNDIDDLTEIPIYDKLKRDDIELSRNEVINLLWNSKEKFFREITCCDYLRVSPYDYRYDPCFSVPLIGKSFFHKNTLETVKQMTSIHHYNQSILEGDIDEVDESMFLLNQQIPLISHRLGLHQKDSSKNKVAFNVCFRFLFVIYILFNI